jgi:hypothetical protein
MSVPHEHVKRPRQKSRKWWQWFLLYPTLAVTFLGAIPQYVNVAKAYVYQVPVKQVFSAQMQNEMWTKNADCIRTAPQAQVTIEKQISVSASACASGDVLVDITYPNDKKVYRWIPFATLEPANDTSSDALLGGISLVTQALAMTTNPPRVSESAVVTQSERQVICQRWLDKRRLLRRIRDTDNTCHDEIVDTYTGKVESQKPAECKGNC